MNDFEMESEDTDSSDEEADEDASEVDKENQHPSTAIMLTTSPRNRPCYRDRYRWLKKDFINPNTDWYRMMSMMPLFPSTHRWSTSRGLSWKTWLKKNTSECSFQKSGASIRTNTKEIEQVIGMYLKMGLMQTPGVRMHWNSDAPHASVSDVMMSQQISISVVIITFHKQLNSARNGKER